MLVPTGLRRLSIEDPGIEGPEGKAGGDEGKAGAGARLTARLMSPPFEAGAKEPGQQQATQAAQAAQGAPSPSCSAPPGLEGFSPSK